MQTWEYCKEYAIRSYAFVFPFLPLTFLWKYFNLSSIILFIIIKNILGLFFIISTSFYLKIISKIFNQSIESYLYLFFLLSPGIFFSSTSYLPSAVCSSLIMLSFSFWLKNSFLLSILFGSITVLWSGWPFVGILFLPIGLNMIYITFIKEYKVFDILLLCFHGLFIVFITGSIALFIDSFMYGKM